MRNWKVPPGWAQARLSQIADVQLGKMLSAKLQQTGELKQYLRNENVRWDAIDFSDVKQMRLKPSELERFAVRSGDLLVCEGGEPGRAAVFRGPNGRYWYQKALHRVRPLDSNLSPILLQFWLEHLAGAGALAPRIAQTTIRHLPLERFREVEVSVPPGAEQRRIVEEIEKQFTRLDATVAALKRIQANLKRYRASVLRAACEGKLLGADRGGPQDLHEGWRWATVDEVATRIDYGSSARTDGTLEGGVPVLRMGNLREGRLDLTDLKYLPADHEEFPDLLLERGDLLFNRTNSLELVGKSAVYRGSPAPCSFASYLIRVRLKAMVVPNFLAFYLNSAAGRAWVKSVATQQVGQANVNGTKLRALRVPLPSLAEQYCIVADVEHRLSVVEELERVVAANLARTAKLRQSILKRAFEGRLVPQDSNDEPAATLLERIRAERASAAPRGRRSRKVTAVIVRTLAPRRTAKE